MQESILPYWRKHRKLGLGFAGLPTGIFGAAKKVPGKRDIPLPSGVDNKDKEEEASKESNSKEAKPKDEKSKEVKPKDAKSKPAEKEDSKPKRPESIGELLKEQQQIMAEEKPEKPAAARIVAYSDSEGEDEPFRLTRRHTKKKEREEEEAASSSDAEEQAASTSAPSSLLLARSGPRVWKAARKCTSRGVTRLRQDAGWGVVLQFLLLWFFRRWKRKEARRFELLTLAVSIPDALCCIAGWSCPSTRLPDSLRRVVQLTQGFARPAAALQLGEGVYQRVVPQKKRRPMLSTISQSVRVLQEAEQGGESPQRVLNRHQPRLAAESAALFKVEMAEMKRILDSQGVKLPPERFDATNAELLRFAAASGLLQAESAEEKAHALQEGAQRVLKTVDWLRKHRFMPPGQLKEWHNLVRWQGSDAQGWPILVIRIAKACAICRQEEAANNVAEAVLGQMQRAMTEVFSNEHGPDKVVVVLDATAANSLQAARNVNLFKHISEVLRKHYPQRLHQLFVVGLPPQLRWVLATLKPNLPPETKQKIRSISVTDPDLPLPESVLAPGFDSITEEGESSDAAPSEGGKSRRMSIPELPVSSLASTPTSSAAASRQNSTQTQTDTPEGERPRRRALIMQLPFREFQPKVPARNSADNRQGGSDYSPGSVLRPALQRSESVGLIGLRSGSQELDP